MSHFFNAVSFSINRLLGYGDVRGLMEEMKSVQDGKSQEELLEKLQKGQFTLRDMYNQFQNIMTIGPLNKVMGMLPGVPNYLIPKAGEGDESTRRLKNILTNLAIITAVFQYNSITKS